MASRQFCVFITVGAASAVIDIGLMQFLLWSRINYLIAATFGFVVGFLFNFLLHSRITFGSRYSHRALIRFMVVVLVNYFLTLLTVSLFHEALNMPLVGKVFSLPLVAVNGFLLSKNWVYR